MKNGSFKLGLPYFFRRQRHSKVSLGTILESLKPESEWDRTQNAIEDILRWADDGGKMLDPVNLIARSKPDVARERTNE
jgi:hypothetical protein